jgi:hypothetical protein
MTNSSWPLFKLGLNPYGMTYYLGLQGRGTSRQNPNGTGLEGFLKIAEELGAKSLEIYDPWLQEFSGNEFQNLKDRLDQRGITPVVSGGYILEETGHVFRSAQLLEAKTIRFALTNVLCGGRAFRTDWNELRQAVRKKILELGKTAADAGLMIAIENHQDFTSTELVEFCEMTLGLELLTTPATPFQWLNPLINLRKLLRLTLYIYSSRTTECSSPMKDSDWYDVRLERELCHLMNSSKKLVNTKIN